MRFQKLICLVLLFAILGCKQKETKNTLRDSIAGNYMLVMASAKGADTSDFNFQMLKAYLKNDTNNLVRLNKDLTYLSEKISYQAKKDSTVGLKDLEDMNADEVYRFDYWQSFCNEQISATISIKNDTAHLHFLLYHEAYKQEKIEILKVIDTAVAKRDWEEFSEAIEHSDFWGLKETNGLQGLDGDGITVMGYKKSKYSPDSKTNSVNRWSLPSTTLQEPFFVVLKLSGNKDGCIGVK